MSLNSSNWSKAVLGLPPIFSLPIRPQLNVARDQHANRPAGAHPQSWPHIELAVDDAPADASGFLGCGVADAKAQAPATNPTNTMRRASAKGFEKSSAKRGVHSKIAQGG